MEKSSHQNKKMHKKENADKDDDADADDGKKIFFFLHFSSSSSDPFDDLDHVLVLQHVLLPDPLRPVLGRRAPDQRVLELLQQAAVDPVAEVLDRRVLFRQDDGLVPVGELALGLGVDAREAQVLPDHLDEAVEVPVEVGADLLKQK